MPNDSSLGRIQASFAQATQELTVAAANLNFDFTLMKFDAPPEYRAIGKLLSTSRVEDAETGPLHVTARRLGALFDGICPQTPNLIKAYGKRASEISSEVTNTDSTRNQNWIHTEYGGIDATSIWAAATSSKAALPVHMLACIIARMWKHTEATSLWVELVTERKREILTNFENGEPTHFNLSSAVQQEITRDHLAKWDASARAWLQTADRARQLQYKQFLLIIQNISIAVHEENNSLYANVIHVWTSALSAMESLVSGRPSVVNDSPVLLGLSAWHLFPDMIVFNDSNGSGSTEIAMHDPLVKAGGILSLGISDPSRKEGRGVYWLLSLAHHRFYGEPVKQTRRLDVDGSRLSFNEFILVCLGCLLRCWGLPTEATHDAFKTLRALVQMVSSTQNGAETDGSLDRVICDPTFNYLEGEKQAVLAVSLGRRRRKFLPAAITTDRKPLFQLLYLPTLLFILKDADHMIELLRRLASRIDHLDNRNSIIVCLDDTLNEKHDSQRSFVSTFLERTETTQSSRHPKKRLRHRRWIEMPSEIERQEQESLSEQRPPPNPLFIAPSKIKNNSTVDCDTPEPEVEHTTIEGQENIRGQESIAEYGSTNNQENRDSNLLTSLPKSFAEFNRYDGVTKVTLENENNIRDGEDNGNPGNQHSTGLNYSIGTSKNTATFIDMPNPGRPVMLTLESPEQTYEKIRNDYLDKIQREHPNEKIELVKKNKTWYQDAFLREVTHEQQSEDPYSLMFGLVDDTGPIGYFPVCEYAALYVKNDGDSFDFGKFNDSVVTLEDVLWCFESGFVDQHRLMSVLKQEPAFAFLQVLLAIHTLYREPAAGGSSISCAIVDSEFKPPIFSKKLESYDWFLAHTYLTINQRAAIGLIGYFETGYDVREGMSGDYNIIGLSGGDSIYILTALLSDPCSTPPAYSFSRVLGNTGRPGFSLLSCPSNLMVRQLDHGAWRVEQTEFDEMPHDYFQNTSLHLSFTDWCAPLVSYQVVGQHDADVNIIEVVVSVRDAGKWVADVDIYQALADQRLIRQVRGPCSHGDAARDSSRQMTYSSMLSVESWDQVLDCAEEAVVVRCFDNWVARLAVVSVLYRHGMDKEMPIVVCPHDMCWKCIRNSPATRSIYVF